MDVKSLSQRALISKAHKLLARDLVCSDVPSSPCQHRVNGCDAVCTAPRRPLQGVCWPWLMQESAASLHGSQASGIRAGLLTT